MAQNFLYLPFIALLGVINAVFKIPLTPASARARYVIDDKVEDCFAALAMTVLLN